MATTVFLLLNGLGVAFFIFVLANFWKEGHRQESQGRRYATEFGQRDWANVLIVTHPLPANAQGGPSVIPFRARGQSSANPVLGTASSDARETPVRRISTS
jgi:hypothetical protein